MFAAQRISYAQTNSFSKIVTDYISGASALKPFYLHAPSLAGIQQAIELKKNHKLDRTVLVQELKKQYSVVTMTAAVQKNIKLLQQENSFTVCTAHQPNLFTGPLYFMYKILHTVRLADFLQKEYNQYNFIPVYYMGSEDADFAELNHTYVDGKKIEWKKVQTGAVGRMRVDKTLIQLIGELKNQLYVEQHVDEVIELFNRCYTEGKDIQTATFELVNELYGKYGLVVLIPDNPVLKRQMLPVFEDDLFQQTSSNIVQQTSAALEKEYKVQANPREINLFYLKENIRERIVRDDSGFSVHNTDITFTEAEMRKELQEHPERFSPNVILRGLFQETVLPNIAFIGGGGELAYWLQLKDLFAHYSVPYPVLVLRNSFLIIQKQSHELMNKLGLNAEDLFLSGLDMLNLVIERQGRKPQLNGELTKVEEVYAALDKLAIDIDFTLSQHIAALKTKTINQLKELEKKMLRAERKKHEALKNKISKLKQALFPLGGLQERVENFSSFHAKWGRSFIDEILNNSLSLEHEFVALKDL